MSLVLLVPLIILLNSVYSLKETALDTTCVSLEVYGSEPHQFFNLPASSLKNESVTFNFFSSMNGGAIILSQIDRITGYRIELRFDRGAIRNLNNQDDMHWRQYNGTTNIFSLNKLAQLSVTIKKSFISAYFMNNNKKWSPLISWHDNSTFDIKLVSFTSPDIHKSSKWLFNCQGSSTTDNAENVSPLKRLKNKIFNIHDPHLIPAPIDKLSINASLNLHYLSLDAKESLLTTHGKFHFSWLVPSMQWDSKKYGNITSFNLLHQEIWLPNFVLFNSYDEDASLTERGVIKISNRGNISWSPEATLVTWCNLALEKWPLDRQICMINFALRWKSNYIDFSLPSKYIKEDSFLENPEWKIISLKATNNTNLWKITFELERNAKTLVYTYLYPTIACVFTTLASCWLPIYVSKRLYLHTACLLILLVNLIALDSALPAFSSSTPHLIILNSHLLLLNAVHLIFCAYIMSKVECYHKSTSKIIEWIISNPFILTLFSLSREPQFYRFKEEIIGEETRQTINQWGIFGKILDRILFILTLIYIIFMMKLYL